MRLCLVVALLVTVGTEAWAKDNASLARARKELDGLQYDKARASLDEALALGTSDPTQVAEIHLLAGQVAGALDDAASAEDHFKRLLVLRPGSTLPSGMSPKITAPFDAARAWLSSHEPLAVDIEAGAETVTVVIESDPLGMIAEARVAVEVGGQTSVLKGRSNTKRITIALPEGELTVRPAVVDAYGNHLVELPAQQLTVGVIPLDPPRPARAVGGRPLYAKWWLWGGVAVAFAGGGTYFGLDALDAQDELLALNGDSQNHDFSEARAVQDRGERSALLANVGFGLAGAAAVAATVLLVTDRRSGPAPIEQRGAAITPLEDGGAALVVFGSF